MPANNSLLDTNLNVGPYFDDFDPGLNYSKILFKPSTAVQVRELNQIQTILQNQIATFGKDIYKDGSVIGNPNDADQIKKVIKNAWKIV